MYAPASNEALEKRQTWWKFLHELICKVTQMEKIILIRDLNIHLYEENYWQSECIDEILIDLSDLWQDKNPEKTENSY